MPKGIFITCTQLNDRVKLKATFEDITRSIVKEMIEKPKRTTLSELRTMLLGIVVLPTYQEGPSTYCLS